MAIVDEVDVLLTDACGQRFLHRIDGVLIKDTFNVADQSVVNRESSIQHQFKHAWFMNGERMGKLFGSLAQHHHLNSKRLVRDGHVVKTETPVFEELTIVRVSG